MKRKEFRILVMLLCVASMTIFASCDNDKSNEPLDPIQIEQNCCCAHECNGESDQTSSGSETETPTAPTTGFENGHEWIDLGLPSGIKWATCNVGADSAYEMGNRYEWGQTDLEDDSYANHISLLREDDAASVNMGGKWRMPTSGEISELVSKCHFLCKYVDGVHGFEVEGPNGKFMFLPCASDYKHPSNYDNYKKECIYWSSDVYYSSPYEYSYGILLSFSTYKSERKIISHSVSIEGVKKSVSAYVRGVCE